MKCSIVTVEDIVALGFKIIINKKNLITRLLTQKTPEESVSLPIFLAACPIWQRASMATHTHTHTHRHLHTQTPTHTHTHTDILSKLMHVCVCEFQFHLFPLRSNRMRLLWLTDTHSLTLTRGNNVIITIATRMCHAWGRHGNRELYYLDTSALGGISLFCHRCFLRSRRRRTHLWSPPPLAENISTVFTVSRYNI